MLWDRDVLEGASVGLNAARDCHQALDLTNQSGLRRCTVVDKCDGTYIEVGIRRDWKDYHWR